MIAVDVSPLRYQPRTGVARALAELLVGLEGLPGSPPFALVPPADASLPASARAVRRAMPAHVRACGAGVFLSPWSAFPRLDVPVVAVVHELPFVLHGPIEGRLSALRHRAWLARDVRSCAAIVVPSEATRRDLLRLHPEAAARLHAIPNAFDPRPWLAARAQPAEPPYAAMVGVGRGRRGAAKKGLDVLLAAWGEARPPGWRLHLVGAPALALPPDVTVHEDLDEDALRALVARASLLVYPSRSEGFGYPPLEAMAAGVAVLTTDAGSIPEVVGAAAHVVAAGSASALAAGLETLAADPGLRAALVEVGAARAASFPPVETARRYVDVLASVEAAS